MMKRLDPFLFILIVFFGLVFAMQGKAIAGYIFTEGGFPVREISVLAHVLCLFLAISLQVIRSSIRELTIRILLVAAISITVLMSIHWISEVPSVLVFSVQLMVLIFVCAVIALEPTLSNRNLSKEFWQLLLGAFLKSIQFLLALYVAGFALLKFLSDGVAESRDSFLTSFIYPTIGFVYGIFIVGYWLGIPMWENLVESHRVSANQHNKGFNRAPETSGPAEPGGFDGGAG